MHLSLGPLFEGAVFLPYKKTGGSLDISDTPSVFAYSEYTSLREGGKLPFLTIGAIHESPVI